MSVPREASRATTRGHGCDVVACAVRQQALHIGFGVLRGSLPLAQTPKGLHEGVEAWQDLRAHLRGPLPCVKPLACAPGVSRVPGARLL